MVQVDVGQSRVKSDLLLATSPVLADPGRSMEATGRIIELQQFDDKELFQKQYLNCHHAPFFSRKVA